jgi:nitrous oxidase accessory protein NosD
MDMRSLFFVLAFLLLLSRTSGEIIHVPSDYTSIQDALDHAGVGDTILVAPGIYYENITWPNVPAIRLFSEIGPESTIVDGGALDRVFYFDSLWTVGSTTIVEGFTIRNGMKGYGAGVYISECSPIIRGNVITENEAESNGSGVFIHNCTPKVYDNLIHRNTADYRGGGIACYWGARPEIMGNTIEENEAGFGGGGIACVGEGTHPEILENTISGNSAEYGGGIYCNYVCRPTISDNNIIDNHADYYGGGIYLMVACDAQIISNEISGNSARYGGGLVFYSSDPKILDNQISENQAFMGGGMFLRGCSSLIQGNTIVSNLSENYGDGIFCYRGASPVVFSNEFIGNGYALFNADSTDTVLAVQNYWGHPSGPYHPILNPDGLGDTISDYVEFEPWPVEEEASLEPRRPTLWIGSVDLESNVVEFRFTLLRDDHVSLRVFNIIGQEIGVLVDCMKSMGEHSVEWKPDGLTPGIYFCRLEGSGFVETGKVLLLK